MVNIDPKGYYKILGLNNDASMAEIKKSYREKAKELHPDHNDSPDALEEFQRLSAAYELLKDEKSRLEYDRWAKKEETANKILRRKFNYGIIMAIPVLIIIAMVAALKKPKDDKINYYQEVRFRTGGETVDDVVVSKVLNIPIDIEDVKMLYHPVENVDVMYGPAEEFDVLTKLKSGHTVRVTGYTPDRIWYRIMLDNGDMGFIKAKSMKQGMKRDVPADSKVYIK